MCAHKRYLGRTAGSHKWEKPCNICLLVSFIYFCFCFESFGYLKWGFAIQPWLAWACDPSPASASAMISLQVSCGWLDLPDLFTQDDALQSRLLPWRKQSSTLLYGWRSRTVCTYHILFMCLATDGNPGCFQNMALVRRRHPCGVWPYSPLGACLPVGSQVLCSFCLCFMVDPSWWFLQWLHQAAFPPAVCKAPYLPASVYHCLFCNW